MAFSIGQRVRTTVDAPAAWDGAFSAPAGTLGTITGLPGQCTGYGVLLDSNPDQLPSSYDENELAAA